MLQSNLTDLQVAMSRQVSLTSFKILQMSKNNINIYSNRKIRRNYKMITKGKSFDLLTTSLN